MSYQDNTSKQLLKNQQMKETMMRMMITILLMMMAIFHYFVELNLILDVCLPFLLQQKSFLQQTKPKLSGSVTRRPAKGMHPVAHPTR